MPFDKSNPPEKIKAMPKAAQSIFISAYNSAYKQYDEDEKKAHQVAYAAVKNKFKQNEKGEWVEKVRYITKDEKRHYTLGVVYEPDEMDTDDEFTDSAELEKACWDFMRKLQGRGEVAKAAVEVLHTLKEAADSDSQVELTMADDVFEKIAKKGVNAMHIEDRDDCEVVECYIAPVDMELNGQKVKKGSWLAGIIWSPELFDKIESGEWTGYSMGGTAQKIAV